MIFELVLLFSMLILYIWAFFLLRGIKDDFRVMRKRAKEMEEILDDSSN